MKINICIFVNFKSTLPIKYQRQFETLLTPVV